jgi:DNA-binding transcriptional regulator YiaG
MGTEACSECGGATSERTSTAAEPYAYTLGGLPGVRLMGVVLETCERCGAEIVGFPRLGQLERVIARELLRKPALLSGDELRFVRKHAGFPAARFAALLGVTPAHLSRFENAHEGNNLGAPADRLARAIVAASCDGFDAREILLRRMDQTGRPPDRPRQAPSMFQFVQNRWRPVD